MTEVTGVGVYERLWRVVSSVTHPRSIDRTKTYSFNYDSTKTVANKDDRPTPFLFSLRKPPASVAFSTKDSRTRIYPSVEM